MISMTIIDQACVVASPMSRSCALLYITVSTLPTNYAHSDPFHLSELPIQTLQVRIYIPSIQIKIITISETDILAVQGERSHFRELREGFIRKVGIKLSYNNQDLLRQ